MTPTPRRRAALSHLADAAQEIDRDFAPERLRGAIPSDWHRISDRPTPERAMMSMRMDKDVLKFFRAFGPGYQARINRVLRAFVLGRIAGLVQGPESRPVNGEACPICGSTGGTVDMDAIRRGIAEKLDRLREERGGENGSLG